MTIKIHIGALLVLILASCAPLARQVGTEVAPQISTEVAVQVGTAVAELNSSGGQPDTAAAEAATASYNCERKTCGEMASCIEAVYKLTMCGHSRLDRDSDGVPCETLCKNADVNAIETSFLGVPSTAPEELAESNEEIGPVTRVVDGDTINVLLDGVNVSIRYLQMNTPERDEPCYREATQANAELVAGKTVRLVADVELVDRYDRLLRFVYVDDLLVNRALVEGGFAEVVLYPPNDAHYQEFLQLEQEAAAAGRGCHPTGIFADGSWTR